MEKVKKMRLVGILLVIAALVAMMIPVTATAAGDNTLVIHKYVMDDMSLAGTAGTGVELTGANTPSGTLIDGITFKVYTISAADITAKGQPAVGVPYTVTGTTLSDGTNSYGLTEAASITTGTDGTGVAEATDLADGLYIVVEQPSPLVDSVSDPFIVTLPMTNPSGNGVMTTVHAYPKNEKLTIHKDVDKTSVQVGDPISFTITAKVPSDLAESKLYQIIDTLDPALTYTGVSFVGASTSASGPFSQIPLTRGTDYTVTPSGNKITIDFPVDGVLKAAGVHYVQITIDATVNSAITDATHNNIVTNTANIDFVNKFGDKAVPGDHKDTESNETTTHAASIEVVKQDANGTKITASNATFKIATAPDGTGFLRQDSNGNVLRPGATGYSDATDIVLDTGTTGIASFDGLDDTADYWLVETKAPTGYNLLTSPKKIDFSSATEDNGWLATINVVDNKGYTLPLTGAAGVAIFTIAGIVLLGTALALIATMKRKNKVADSQTV